MESGAFILFVFFATNRATKFALVSSCLYVNVAEHGGKPPWPFKRKTG